MYAIWPSECLAVYIIGVLHPDEACDDICVACDNMCRTSTHTVHTPHMKDMHLPCTVYSYIKVQV